MSYLPKGLKVTGTFNIGNTKIKELPTDLIVGILVIDEGQEKILKIPKGVKKLK